MAALDLRGTYTALVTPFKKDLTIDFDKFNQLLDFQIENGVDGVVVCGSTGESATMSNKEKIALIVSAVEHVKGRIKVIAGTGSNDTAATIDLSILAKEAGVDALLIVCPYYNKPTQEGLYYHYKAIADAVDIPQILYNVPSRSGVNIQAEIQLKLAKDCKNIIATKEASGNMDQVMEIIRKKPNDFFVLSGEDSLTVPLIAMGADGVIGVMPNYAPKMFSDAVSNALKGNIKTAARIHYKLFDLMQLNFIESNPIPVKAALGIMGKLEENYRSPLYPIHPDNRKKLEKAMRKLKLI